MTHKRGTTKEGLGFTDRKLGSVAIFYNTKYTVVDLASLCL